MKKTNAKDLKAVKLIDELVKKDVEALRVASRLAAGRAFEHPGCWEQK